MRRCRAGRWRGDSRLLVTHGLHVGIEAAGLSMRQEKKLGYPAENGLKKTLAALPARVLRQAVRGVWGNGKTAWLPKQLRADRKVPKNIRVSIWPLRKVRVVGFCARQVVQCRREMARAGVGHSRSPTPSPKAAAGRLHECERSTARAAAWRARALRRKGLVMAAGRSPPSLRAPRDRDAPSALPSAGISD